MKRRDFITLAGGAAAMLPLAARAHEDERVRRIGVLGGLAESDPEMIARVAVLDKALSALGWTARNVRIDYRWAGGNADNEHKYAAELVALQPDVILAEGSPTLGSLLRATRTIPIVFANVVDPVGSGFVASLAHPGGNATGFTQFEYRIAGKWLELLKEVAPRVSRVAVVRDPGTGPGIGQFAAIQALAPPGDLELSAINAVEASEIERGVTAFAQMPNSGLIITAGGTAFYRAQIVALAARLQLPAVYPFRYFSTIGGLISFGPNSLEPTHGAAGYIDRILRGERPADLPVQAPTKYELIINLKTAKSLGLTIPQSLLATADDVIE
jgi:putative tryptophan/tyrosine transport system substrate-binding protein